MLNVTNKIITKLKIYEEIKIATYSIQKLKRSTQLPALKK